MIGLAMERWDDAALRRVVDAPIGRWRDGWFLFADGSGCLIGHAFNAAAFSNGKVDQGPEIAMTADFDAVHEDACGGLRESENVQNRFDELCGRFGLPRTVRACKQRALAILLRRHPLTTYTPHDSAVNEPAPTVKP